MKQTQLAAALVAVNFGGELAKQLGTSVVVDANSIEPGAWQYHHGKASDGTQVNSPRTIEIGKSVILQSEDGAAIAMETPQFEVAAAGFLLKQKGYKVTPPSRQ